MTAGERTPGVLDDAEARRQIREDLDTTLFVEAAAGTGKTTELVSRIVAILRSGRGTLDRIVAVTFTDKAAGEMKLRLRAEIERARSQVARSHADDPDSEAEAKRELRRFDAALAQLEVARISTLHAFCSDLLHERPVEAGVDPLFEVAPDDQTRRVDRSFDEWFQAVLGDPPEGVRRVLRRTPRGLDAAGPRSQLRNAARALIEHRDFAAPWRRDPFDRNAEIDRVFALLVEVGELSSRASNPRSYLAQSIQTIRRFTREVLRREGAVGGERDYDGLESELREFARPRFSRHWNWKGSGNQFGPGLARADVLAMRDAAKANLDALREACDADLAPRLHDELQPVVRIYESHKDREGQLDFLDLLVRTRDLLRHDTAVRALLQRRFSHFFVDEFQDTDPLQSEILLLLCADDPAQYDYQKATPAPGKLFLVGDPKQSIYRFRRADVALYESIKARLAAAGAAVVYLTTSFRSVPAIQSLVNGAFGVAMSPPDGSEQARYVALAPFRGEAPGQPAVVALPVPRPYKDWGDNARVTNREIEASFPDAAAAFVDWLIRESGWTVAEGDERVPIAARHVCLLFRRFRQFDQDATRPYVRGLEARRIPHVLVGGRSFHDREEVLAIRNALFAIEWPADGLRVFATLRGPLFALGDDALLAFRHQTGGLHPLRELDEASRAALGATEREVADALEVLRELHIGRNQRPIADTVSRLLAAVRAHAGIAIWPTGEQALANCLRVIDLARRFERRGASSFRAFAEQLEDDAERGEAQEAPVVEEGTEGVRIMTVHKAKGLEFPVVLLADPTCNASREPSRHVDASTGLWAERICGCAPPELQEAREEEAQRELEEAVRVAYVAATRARDLLVVPVIGDEQPAPAGDMGLGSGVRPGLRPGWLAALHDAVHPPRAKRREALPAPGCPSARFGEDSVLDRPRSAGVGAAASVAPGRHRARVGEHDVVWWDPRALVLDQQEDVGLRQQRILEADEGGETAAEGERAFEAWRERRAAVRERGATATLVVEGVAQRTHGTGDEQEQEPDVGEIAVALESTSLRDEERSQRPGGTRFGTLVHAVLAAVDLAADADEVQAAAIAEARLLGSPAAELAACATAVTHALGHPILARAREAQRVGGLRRETPVLLALQGGTLIEGVVDLAFRVAPGESWTVVDFKTDREIPAAQLAGYEAQVRLYARAIAAATGEAVNGVLLRV
jgi:ATP-dependent helicase/nuclease subunit A